MPSLVITRTKQRSEPAYSISTRGDDGTLSSPLVFTLNSVRQRVRASAELKVPVETLMGAISHFLKDEEHNAVYEIHEPAIIRTSFGVRAERGNVVTNFGTLPDALSNPVGNSSLVVWSDIHETCCLDLDFHGVSAPSRVDITAAAESLQPSPAHWWLSKGGGLHAIYHRHSGFPADELAAIAAVRLLARFPEAGVELKTSTRFPPGERHDCTQSVDTSALVCGDSGSTVDSDRVAAYLSDRGMEYQPGTRYDHSFCPCDPNHASANPSPPVVVLSEGIYCHSCAGRGLRRGAGKPGWFPFHSLCGGYTPSLLRSCVWGFTHWGHARFIVATLYPSLSESVARSLYAATLRMRHGDNPRLPRAMSAGEPLGLIRFDGYWVTSDGEPYTANDRFTSILASLPAAQFVTEDGEVKTAADKVSSLAQPVDLTKVGYPPIRPVYGIQLTQFQGDGSRVYTTLQTGGLKYDINSSKRPRYLHTSERAISVEDAWKVLERAFPKLDRNAITLCIAAKGCVECHAGMSPMIFFTGPTGSGKTGSIHIAAAICGDQTSNVQYEATDRLRAGVISAKMNGSFVIFDEFIKGANRARVAPDAAMETLLGFTPDSTSHKLYIGPVRMGDLPVFCWADTTIPPDVQSHQQIGRRVWHVPLYERMEWKPTLQSEGLLSPAGLRVHGGEDYIIAANVILSSVIDAYFLSHLPVDFDQVAAGLGFRKLEESDLSAERKRDVANFFKLVCAAPDIPDGLDKRRWPGPGWKIVDLSRPDEALTDAWDALTGSERTYSRLLGEMDLAKECGLKCKTRFESSKHGNKIACRFVAVDNPELTNGGLYAKVELEPVQGSVDGPRDSERVEPEVCRGADVPPALDNPDYECRISVDGVRDSVHPNMDSDRPVSG